MTVSPFWPEVKVTVLNDSSMTRMQSTETTFAGIMRMSRITAQLTDIVDELQAFSAVGKIIFSYE